MFPQSCQVFRRIDIFSFCLFLQAVKRGKEALQKPTESSRSGEDGVALVTILASGAVGVVVGVAVVVSVVVIYRARQMHRSSSTSLSSKTNQYLKTSEDPLLEVPHAGSFKSTAPLPSCGQFFTHHFLSLKSLSQAVSRYLCSF